MSLAKQTSAFEELPSLGPNYGGFDHQEGNNYKKTNNEVFKNSSSLGSTSSSNSNGFIYYHSISNHQQSDLESRSLIDFQGGFSHLLRDNGSNVHSFQKRIDKVCSNNAISNKNKDADHSSWVELSCDHRSEPRIMEDFSCFQTASNFSSLISNGDHENEANWFFSEVTDHGAADHTIQDCGSTQDSASHKRSTEGESTQSVKKQCNSGTKKAKPKSSPSKDPQSVAAKIRRERISERLKILQELIPNGSKVDLVTMLEKAISYVKFLQLQVKVLATDEFWPVQGGKAPDISQVKEAIDAILSSQRDRNSSSSSK